MSPPEFAALVRRMREAQRAESSVLASYKPHAVKAAARLKARSLEQLVDAESARQAQQPLWVDE